jgi:hypothetical protein
MYDVRDEYMSALEGEPATDDARGLAAVLERELRIEPLPAALEQRIRRELDGVRVPAAAPWSLRLARVSGLAAAAGLLAAMLVPRPAAFDRGPLVVNEEESRVIAYTVAELKWSDPLEVAVDRLSRRVASVDRALDRTEDEDSILPWSPSDDWDRPREDETDAQRSQRRSLHPVGVGEVLPDGMPPATHTWRYAHV